MSLPSPSERLFFSSSPSNTDPGPAEEVDNILTQVQQIDRLDPIFDAIVNSSPDAFFDGFSRKIELIKSRTQAFEVCHITVFDKVLLALTQNGNDLNTTSAIAYYCEEFLGIPSGMALSKKDEIVSHMLQIPSVIAQELTPPMTQRGSISTLREGSTSPEKAHLDSIHSDDLATIIAQTGNDITIRIWKVYETAKEEFYAITDATSFEKQEAAKFLRDTAENTLQHLGNEYADPSLRAELERGLAVAKHTAEILSGGRKRKFDQPNVKPARRVERPQVERPRPQARGAREDRRNYEERRTLSERRENYLFDGHARALSHPSRYDAYPDRHNDRCSDSRSRRQLMSPELSPRHESRDRKRSKKQPGRGHSGIPFGYTRNVDSYQPPS